MKHYTHFKHRQGNGVAVICKYVLPCTVQGNPDNTEQCNLPMLAPSLFTFSDMSSRRSCCRYLPPGFIKLCWVNNCSVITHTHTRLKSQMPFLQLLTWQGGNWAVLMAHCFVFPGFYLGLENCNPKIILWPNYAVLCFQAILIFSVPIIRFWRKQTF